MPAAQFAAVVLFERASQGEDVYKKISLESSRDNSFGVNS
jgi:hypothetical protein